jgi:hypothetical protein
MLTPSKLTTIKWASGNTVIIEIERNNARLYLTKREALDLIEAVTMFRNGYQDDFTPENIDYEDITDDDDWILTHG